MMILFIFLEDSRCRDIGERRKPIIPWLWRRETAWRQWLFTISIWIRARLKPIMGTMANSSWQNEPQGSLPADFILMTTQKSGLLFFTNGVFWGAKWNNIICCCLNQFGGWQNRFSPGQIFISCFLILQHGMTDHKPADTKPGYHRDTAAGVGAPPHATSSNLERTAFWGSS